MRSYEEMLESGDWPPTNRETIRMVIGLAIGLVIGFALGIVVGGGA